MGADGLVLLNALSGEAGAWAARMGHACVSGGLFALGVWAVCRLAPRLPASTRGWLWWLACLKMAFDLCGAAPLPLPILPAAPPLRVQPAALSAPTLPPATSQAIAGKPAGNKAAFAPDDADGRPAPSAAARPTWPLCLQVLWLLGLALCLGQSLRQGLRLRRLVRTAQPAALPESTLAPNNGGNGIGQAIPSSSPIIGGRGAVLVEPLDLVSLANALGLHHLPRILESPAVANPCVTGVFCPTILLPTGLCETLSPDELRLALAHELAHVHRADLRLALLPALVRAIFFFHPLVWLACAEWANAREETCDALALHATGAHPAHYGHLLLKMASGETRAPALGLSSGYRSLKRRLVGLTHPSGRLTVARWLLALALPLLLPWRLTAATRLHSLNTPAEDATTTRYAITDLGEVTDGDSEAAGMNNAGQIAGTALSDDDTSQGFAWNGGQATPLGALPKHHFSIAYGINGTGQIAAASYNIPGHGRAFLWNGVPHRLGSLPGFPYSEARGVNDAGQVAGFAETGSRDRWQAQIARAFLWQSGQMTDLGTLGGPYSYAYGLNNSGMVVGKADTNTFGQTHAFVWQNGQMQDLGTLGGANSLAYRVNDGGQIVGSSETGAGDQRHAFLWQAGQMRDLGALPGTSYSVAYDVNAQGDVVGSAEPVLGSPAKRAFLWRSGHLTDLNALLPARSAWTLQEARAINDKGQIAGEGRLNGHLHAFLLTPR